MSSTPEKSVEKSPSSGRSWWYRSTSKTDVDEKKEEEQPSVEILVPQFIKSIPPKSESALKAKVDVCVALDRRREKLREQLRKSLADNDDVTTTEKVCNELDVELKKIIAAYIKPITDAALSVAKSKVPDVIPRDPTDIGIPLPIRLETKLEEAIEKKRRVTAAQLMKSVENYHFSWYMEDKSIGFELAMDTWANNVRSLNKTLCKRWRTSTYFLALIVPVVVSVVALLAMKGCQPGHRVVLPSHPLGPLEPVTCSVCPPGTHSYGTNSSFCPMSLHIALHYPMS